MSIAVAVSGGADSLLSLLLLKGQDWPVVAIHAHFLPLDDRQKKLTRSMEAICHAQSIPFVAVDLSELFRLHVIQPFIESYLRGETPNPCAQCNRTMKFGLLRQEASRLGCDLLATGHYAILRQSGTATGLYRGQDPIKDQSYFLSLVPQEALQSAVFPLGQWHKSETLDFLKTQEIIPPVRAESQEICFIPNDDYRRFLADQGESLSGPGPIVDTDKRLLGRHQGLWAYTIGQRRGLGIAHPEPLYVLHKEYTSNTLVVGHQNQLFVNSCRTKDVNLLVPPSSWPNDLMVQTVYRQSPRPAQVQLSGDEMIIHFLHPEKQPCPGQIAAVYSTEGQVLAGGLIQGE